MRRVIISSLVLCIIVVFSASAGLLLPSYGEKETPKVLSAIPSNALTLVASGKTALQNQNLLAGRDYFIQALAADPSNQEANLLYGVTRIISVLEEGQSLNTTGLDSVREILELSGTVVYKLNAYDSHIAVGKKPAASTPSTGAILAFLKTKMLPEVDGAIANLTKVTNPSFNSIINPPVIGGTGTNINIDYADALVIKSLLFALKCNLEILMVYGLDVSIPSVFDNPDQLMIYKKLLQQDATLLTPKEPARLTTAKGALVNFIDTYSLAAVPALKARTGAMHHLFVVDVALSTNEPVATTTLELNAFMNKLAEVKMALSGANEFTGTGTLNERTIDLSRFFNAAAPINARAQLANCSSGTALPDSTIGGLFPLGLDLALPRTTAGPDILGVACTGRETPLLAVEPSEFYFNEYYYSSPYAPYDKYSYASGPAAITLNNFGTAPLVISSTALTGINSNDFTLNAGSCSSLTPTLAASKSCFITVSPKHPVSVTGWNNATLQIASNDLSNPLTTVSLYGSINTIPGGSISGIVTDAKNGTVLDGAGVYLYAAADISNPVQTTSTNERGGYAFANLSPGSYKIRVYVDQLGDYQEQWYNAANNSSSANSINLAVNANLSQINFSLGYRPVTMSSAGVTHRVKSDGSQVDTFDVIMPTSAETLGGMTLTVTGPNGFTYTFTNKDVNPWFTNSLLVYKEFSSLPSGTYTFTLNDGNGNISSRTDNHVTVNKSIPIVGSKTIQYQWKEDGSYRFSWASVNNTSTYYYRIRISLDDGIYTPVYVSPRANATFVDVTLWTLAPGTSYNVRVEAYDSSVYNNVTNRSDSAYAEFNPFAQHSLSTLFSGTGGGSVNGSISCISGSTCPSVEFNHGTPVTLVASPNATSTFTGWSGACTNVTGNCNLTMNSNKTVTANFTAAPKAKVGTKTFTTLQTAYNDTATTDDSIIKLLEGTLANTLIAGRGISVKLEGGYNASFNGLVSETTIQGPVKLRAGTVKVKGIKVK